MWHSWCILHDSVYHETAEQIYQLRLALHAMTCGVA